MLCRHILPLLLIVLAGSPVCAQGWARKMFKTTEHDFGYVARGAKAEFEFVFSNIYIEDVHVAGVRSSCGCTSVRIKKPLLETYEESAIIARFNTGAFLGRKGATITVRLDKPFYAEVRLQVTGHIRSDVVLRPGSVELGTVNRGASAETKIHVNYAGRSDWRILEVRSANPHISGEVLETSRGGGQVSYELSVRIDEHAPAGYVKDHLLLITNDRQTTQVPVAVEGRVLSNLTVSPSSLFMGVVQPGQRVTKQLVVRSTKPFRVLSVSCDAECFEFDDSAQQTPKPLHVIPVTFVAGDDPGKVIETIRIETDLGESAPVLSAYAVVSAQ